MKETYAEEGEEGEEVYIEEGSGLYGRRRRRRMAKIITLEEGQYCQVGGDWSFVRMLRN